MSPADTSRCTPFFRDQVAIDPIYDAIRRAENKYAREAKDLVEFLWQVAAPYVDEDIQRKAVVRFHAHFWELYLAASLVRTDVPLVRRAESSVRDRGPDLQIAHPPAWIEAVTATPGAGPDAVTEGRPGVARDVPDDAIKLRILNAIDEKVRTFERYISSGLVATTDPCIIAVNTGAVPCATLELAVPRIVRCLFPFGHEVIEISRSNGRVVGRRYEYRPEVSKLSGATVATTGFEAPGWSRISAVIHSAVDVFRDLTMIGSDFVIVHNAGAENPLPLGFLKLGTEYWVEGDSICGLRWWGAEAHGLHHDVGRTG